MRTLNEKIKDGENPIIINPEEEKTMTEQSKHQIRKQLKLASGAIDLIKISQRTQHTSIKEALRKMLRGISLLADIDIGEIDVKINKDLETETRRALMKKAKEIREKREKIKAAEENKDD